MLKIVALLFAFLPLSINTSCTTTPNPQGGLNSGQFQMSGNSDVQTPPWGSGGGKKKGKIQVALLVDTSNSMDGLIDQAKSQIWKMVNKLASAKKEGEFTDIEIALFEYGNDNLAMGEGYVRMVSSLSKDVDGLSEQLFKLKTNGQRIKN